MVELKKLSTEQRNAKTMALDLMSPKEIVTVMNEEDNRVVEAVRSQIDSIAKAVEITTNAFENGGRLIYMGAGTSGRLGVLDAVECVPTFGVDEDMVIGLIAGGEKAFVKAVEGSEDSMKLGREDLKKLSLSEKDVVVGIAASGRTPYVIGGMLYAEEVGCKKISIACCSNSKISEYADVVIEVVAGPEILTGSTRLKAGSCQKMILNMISTASMVGIGKVYENLMVDVLQTNEKLQTRAQNIVMQATGVDRERAASILKECDGNAKTAIVAILLDCNVTVAKQKLDKAGGKVRLASKKS